MVFSYKVLDGYIIAAGWDGLNNLRFIGEPDCCTGYVLQKTVVKPAAISNAMPRAVEGDTRDDHEVQDLWILELEAGVVRFVKTKLTGNAGLSVGDLVDMQLLSLDFGEVKLLVAQILAKDPLRIDLTSMRYIKEYMAGRSKFRKFAEGGGDCAIAL